MALAKRLPYFQIDYTAKAVVKLNSSFMGWW